MLILGQKSSFLGPTIFKIPQLNWHYLLYCALKVLRIVSFVCFLEELRTSEIAFESYRPLDPLFSLKNCFWHSSEEERVINKDDNKSKIISTFCPILKEAAENWQYFRSFEFWQLWLHFPNLTSFYFPPINLNILRSDKFRMNNYRHFCPTL